MLHPGPASCFSLFALPSTHFGAQERDSEDEYDPDADIGVDPNLTEEQRLAVLERRKRAASDAGERGPLSSLFFSCRGWRGDLASARG